MKATINICGVGERRTGTSKAGNSYDFIPLSFTYADCHTEGLKAATVNVDMGCLPNGIPFVGQDVEAIMYEQGFRLHIAAIL